MNQLRVSVATYNQVIFPHPENGAAMLALERKATALKDGSVNVRAQPFGGGVRILNPHPLKEMLGEIQFDSEHSEKEQDFRILIQPSQWDVVKRYCLFHLENPDDTELESTPARELIEEFDETLGVDLKSEQYMLQPIGFVIENNPVWTENWYAQGQLTVRVYRTFNVQIRDESLCKTIVAGNQQISDQEFGKLALDGGKDRANSVLALPLSLVTEAYLALPPEMRYRRIKVENHELDESVLVILKEVNVPQYQRMET